MLDRFPNDTCNTTGYVYTVYVHMCYGLMLKNLTDYNVCDVACSLSLYHTGAAMHQVELSVAH